MKKARFFSLSVALIALAVNGLVLRQHHAILRPDRECTTGLLAGRRADGNSSAQNMGKRRPQSRKFVRDRTTDRDFAFLKTFASAEEIDAWMENLVKQKVRGTLEGQIRVFSSWSSYQETNFIRSLRDRCAYAAIESFVEHFGRKNVFVYTAAIASLASSENHREKAYNLLHQMDLYHVRPSSYTFSALFQAAQTPKEAITLKERFETSYPDIRWTSPVFQAAIYACSRGLDGDNWSIALGFFDQMKTQGLRPTPRIYVALFRVCATTGNVSAATALLMDLLDDEKSGTPLTSRMWGAVLQVYAEAGDHEAALRTLKTMSERRVRPNVLHCTAYLKALASTGMGNVSLQFLNYMAGLDSSDQKAFEGIRVAPPDKIAIQTVLSACAASENYVDAKRILDKMKAGSYGEDIQPDEQCYHLVLAACREPEEAKQLVREMRLTRRYRVGAVPPTHITYTRAITVCRKACDVESALFLLNRAWDDGIEPDVYMYSAAIWTAARAGDCDTALEIMDEMTSHEYTPNVVSYNGLIAAFSACGRMEDAFTTFEAIEATGLRPTLLTFYHLARATRRISQVEEKIEMLERIYKSMDRSERYVSVGGPILEALISAYGSVSKYKEARAVFESIEGPSDADCLRAMLFACSTAQPPRWEEALALLHTSDIVGGADAPVYVDSGTLSNAMLACSKAGQWEESLRLFRLYGSNTTSVLALNSLIAACGRGGRRPDVAIEILNEVEDCGLLPDVVSYRSIIIACNHAEHEVRRTEKSDSETVVGDFEWWECAVSLLRRMQEQGLRPDTQTFSSAISACEAAGQWQRALSILQSMMDQDEDYDTSTLNLYCFNAAISACGKGGAWVEALEIYERMKEEGGSLQPNSVTLGSLVLALDRAGQKELAQSKYEEGLRMRILDPWRTSRDSDGNKVRVMDLHKFSAAMARAAIRSHMDYLLSSEDSTIEEDLIVVVGKGLRSANYPVLMPIVKRLLELEFGVPVQIDGTNAGRLIVAADSLREFVSRKSWR